MPIADFLILPKAYEESGVGHRSGGCEIATLVLASVNRQRPYGLLASARTPAVMVCKDGTSSIDQLLFRGIREAQQIGSLQGGSEH